MYDAGAPAVTERMLARPDRWQTLDSGDDPFASHRPAQVDCGIAGYYPEYDALEIDTGYCNYLAIEQPALVRVRAGDELVLEILHFDLTAPEPAEAHIALSLAGELQWETELAIPQPANLVSVSVPATRALAEGEPVQLHLHNHGQNTWQLTKLAVRGR